MRILNISAHETLEADQVNMFVELGHEKVCSTGFFRNPEKPQTIIRKSTKNKPDYDFIAKFEKHNPFYILPSMHPNSGMCFLPHEIVDDFDVVILDYYPWMLNAMWPVFSQMKAKLVIRTLGFGNAMVESYYARAKYLRPDIKIVRLSERERFCEGYCGEDAVITQSVNPDDYLEWNGNNRNVLTVNKMFKARSESCGYEKYLRVTEPFKKERILCGNANEDIEFAQHVDFDTLKRYLADSRCYLSTMSLPASCRTFAMIEALCQGIPIVSYGNGTGNVEGKPTFEIDKIIEHGVNGYYSDDDTELQGYIRALLDDHELAKKVGAKGRETGLSLFHWDIIKEQWHKVLENL